MIRVTVWNEYEHERTIPAIHEVYPEGIHGALKKILQVESDITVTCATLDEPEQGLSEELLKNTDVLIWWSHARQDTACSQRDGVHRTAFGALQPGVPEAYGYALHTRMDARRP